MSLTYLQSRKCAVTGCGNTYPTVKLFRFPRSLKRYVEWCKVAKNPRLPLQMCVHAYMCEFHFKDNMFKTPAREALVPLALPYLSEDKEEETPIATDPQAPVKNSPLPLPASQPTAFSPADKKPREDAVPPGPVPLPVPVIYDHDYCSDISSLDYQNLGFFKSTPSCEDANSVAGGDDCNDNGGVDHSANALNSKMGNLCRICANVSSSFVPIFTDQGLKEKVEEKIHHCLPITVSSGDTLPLQVCSPCLGKLNECHKLINSCVEGDKKLRALLEEYYTCDSECLTEGGGECDSESFGGSLYQEEIEKDQNFISRETASPAEIDFNEADSASGDVESCKFVVVEMSKNGQMATKQDNVKEQTTIVSAEQKPKRYKVVLARVNSKHKYLLQDKDLLKGLLKGRAEHMKFGRKVNSDSERSDTLSNYPCAAQDYHSNTNHTEESQLDICPVIKNETSTSTAEGGNNGVNSLKEETSSEPEVSIYSHLCSSCGEVFESGQELLEHHQSLYSDCMIQNNVSPLTQNSCERSSVSGHDSVKEHEVFSNVEDPLNGLDPLRDSNKMSLPANDSCEITNLAEFLFEIDSSSFIDGKNLSVNITGEFNGVRKNVKSKLIKAVQGIVAKRMSLEGEAKELNDESDVKKETYKCDVCSKTFTKKVAFDKHIETHAMSLICQFCGKCCTSEGALKSHEWRHNGPVRQYERKRKHPTEPDGTNTCTVCCKVFKSKVMLEKHIALHSRIRSLICEICGKECNTQQILNNHVATHSNARPHLCEICGKGFKTRSTLLSHNLFHNKKHACEYCGKHFAFLSKKNLHIRVHTGERPFACHVCDKSFHLKELLRQHMNIHGELQLFECEECGVKFNRVGNLTTHKRLHMEFPYTCKLCNEQFTNRGTYLEHRRGHGLPVQTREPRVCDVCGKVLLSRSAYLYHCRTHTGNWPYSCQYCSKGFVHKYSRDAHHRMHTGETPYFCRICGKRFPSSNACSRHKATHSTERRFLCTFCPKMFRLRKYLKVHIRIHTGERPYSCHVCNRSFKQSNGLVRHRKRHFRNKLLQIL